MSAVRSRTVYLSFFVLVSFRDVSWLAPRTPVHSMYLFLVVFVLVRTRPHLHLFKYNYYIIIGNYISWSTQITAVLVCFRPFGCGCG